MKKSIFDTLVSEALDGQLFDDQETFELDDVQDTEVTDEIPGEEVELDADEIVSEVLGLRDAANALLSKLGYTEDESEDEVEEEVPDMGEEEAEEIEDLEKESVDLEAVPDAKGASLQKGNKVVDNTGDLEGAGKDEGEKEQYRFVKIKKPEVKQTKTTD